MRLQKQLEQENFLLDMKNNHYESELEVEMEPKQVAQKGCGIPILGDEQNLADREGSDHPSSALEIALLRIGSDSPLTFLII